MIFELCEYLREQISDINDTVLEKLDIITAKESVDTTLQTQTFSTKENYTPVTKETFTKWCVDHMAKLNKEAV